jgi:exodeoxyribonuclease VII large subunit
MAQIIMTAEQTLDLNSTALIEQFTWCLEGHERQLAHTQERMAMLAEQQVTKAEQQVAKATSELHAFSPLATLARGYAIATNQAGKVLTSTQQVSVGEQIQVKLSNGQLECEVLRS